MSIDRLLEVLRKTHPHVRRVDIARMIAEFYARFPALQKGLNGTR
jgi:hypothetical protein